MFGIILSALNSMLGFILRGVVVKFVIMAVCYFVVSELFGYITYLLPKNTDIVDLYNMLPDSMIFFSNLFLLPYGLKIAFSAMFTRFIIRRIPLVG
ncbi:TPA: DUF2523 family protein [Escherichia coli]|uniref:DUF2523 domain-containing protein n=1 Tax=Salmonella enterica TaxID=28901 RepID=A0A5V5HM36_SALER|nr:DUF2523 family protein [Citrobacter portucalensis]EAP5605229.1 DUF2523 domain-containing protein [Salmonella enterica]EBU4654747.1 DUF2523 domain-containing protein [Salmonella enterica]EGB3539338.1 DUF2523 domain-containing protein [Salmonella enterica]EIL3500194.1 DUF2523 domain-containing protein [Salmonella enterica]EJB5413784.1 DUF2523 domain-containing protein [Salmonella enterica]